MGHPENREQNRAVVKGGSPAACKDRGRRDAQNAMLVYRRMKRAAKGAAHKLGKETHPWACSVLKQGTSFSLHQPIQR